MMMANGARTDKNGNFTIANVAPGDYTLQSRALTIVTSGGGDNMMFTARLGAAAGGSDGETGSMPVSVSGDELTGVVIVTSKGASVAGHLTFDGGAKPTALTAIRVSAAPVDTDAPVMMFGGGGGMVKADGSFELKGLSGTRLIRAFGLPAGWMLKEVRVNGADVTDTGVDFRASEAITGAEIVLTAKLTEVKGTVTAAGSQPAKDYTLAVFSDDPQRWTLPVSRYVTGTRPDQEGRFEVKGLPAGGYYAIAVEYLAQGEWNDPEVLERLKPNATRFSIAEGQTKVLELRLEVTEAISAAYSPSSAAASSSVSSPMSTAPFRRACRYAIRNVIAISPSDSHFGTSKWIQPIAAAYSTRSLAPTSAMMMKAPSTSVG